MRERRAHERRNVNHRGILSFNDGRSAVACRLVNLSEGGVLVRVDTPQMLPPQVSLIYDRLDEPTRIMTPIEPETITGSLNFNVIPNQCSRRTKLWL